MYIQYVCVSVSVPKLKRFQNSEKKYCTLSQPKPKLYNLLLFI